jgi:peptide/nickel transport system substrate-binding protein
VRNPFFREWSPAAQPRGYPDEIVWRFGGAADNIAAVEHERADIATSSGLFTAPPVEVTARLQTQYASRVRLNPTQAVFYLSLNTKLPPFDDVRVRKAVNLAVDRGRLVAIFGGSAVAEPTCQVLPPNFDAYRRYCPYTVDPRADGTWTGPDLARARRLVDASGTKGQSVTVWGWTASTSHIGPYVVSVLRRLGYRADFKLSKDMFAIASNVQAAEEAWAANIVTPSGMFTPVLTCDGTQGEDPQNDSLFCDARVEAKIARARSLQATDPRTASRLWRMIDRDIVDAAPWVPYVTPRILDFLSSRVGNYEFNPQFGVLVDQLWVR